jgi:hypothetical protein
MRLVTLIHEMRRRIHEPAQLHHAPDVRQLAHRRLALRDQVDAANPRRMLAGRQLHVVAEPPEAWDGVIGLTEK